MYGYNYSDEQQMIIGISPTCTQTPIPQNITSVPYTQVFDTKKEQAVNNIILPADGSTLTVEPGGNYTIEAGNSIVLKPGFQAKAGSFFQASIKDFTNLCNCGGDLYISSWTNFLSPNGDGYNDELCFYAYHANTYEIHIIDNYNNIIYQGAGYFTNDYACVWNGVGGGNGDYCYFYNNYNFCSYRAIIIFRNNCGQLVDNDYIITAAYPYPLTKEIKIYLDSSKFIESTQYFDYFYSNLFTIYPNPNYGTLTLTFIETPEIFNISITNSLGKIIYNKSTSNFPINIDISSQPQGIYYLKALSKNYQFIRKVIKL
jgi:hypothetical protein